MSNVVTVTLPDIGEGVVEGEVVEWLKKEGDTLGQDEPVVVVMTDKATVELPSPYPGRLLKQYYRIGEIALKGKPLYDIETRREKGGEKKEPVFLEVSEKREKEEKLPKKAEGEKAKATPVVRRLAKEAGIDIHQVKGSGEGGRILKGDLKSACTPSFPKAVHFPDDKEEQVFGIKGVMAKKMAESKRLIPHFSYHEKVEALRLIKLYKSMKKEGEKEGVQVTFVPFFIRALFLTIEKFPLINSSYEEESKTLLIHKHCNIGIAMATEKGLIVPVLKEVQSLSLNEIIRHFDKLKKKAMAGELKSEEMKDATITLSNYGVLEGEGLWATPIINYPEAAILAVNKIQKQPALQKESVVVKDMLNLSWSFDHRIIDGSLAAKVSGFYCRLIKNPGQLLAES